MGGGIYLGNLAKFSAYNSTLSGNSAGFGSAIGTATNSQVYIYLESTALLNNVDTTNSIGGALWLVGNSQTGITVQLQISSTQRCQVRKKIQP